MFAGQMADLSKTAAVRQRPVRDGKGALFEGGCRVVACANWPGHIKPQTVDGIIHAVDIYPTFTTLAGASTAKCKAARWRERLGHHRRGQTITAL